MGKKSSKKRATDMDMAMDMETGRDLASSSPLPNAMDTEEVCIQALKVKPNPSNFKKQPAKRRADRLRKEKAMERALLISDKMEKKLQSEQSKKERVVSLKKLY